MDGCATCPSSAPCSAASATPATAPEQQQQQQQQQQQHERTTDQTSGELEPCIRALAAIDLRSKMGDISAALEELQSKAPETFSQLSKFQESVALASALSDVTASRWKEQANSEYQAQNLDMAILNYTKAMTFCETDDLMSTLLNNRSTALFAQSRWRDCCLDVTYALTLKPDYWKALQRRSKCLATLGYAELACRDTVAAEQQDASLACSRVEVLELLHADQARCDEVVPTNPAVRAVSPHIHIECDIKGRHFVADRRLDKGQTLLVETPFALAQRLEGTFTSCALCLRRTSLLYASPRYRERRVRCRGLFCSESCAERYWELYGHSECRNIFFLVCPVDALLAFRMLRSQCSAVTPPRSGGANGDAAGVEEEQHLRLHRERDASNVAAGNEFGATFVSTLTVFSKEIQPIAEVGGRETIVTCLALAMGAIAMDEALSFRHHMRRVVANAMSVSCVDRVLPAATPEQHTFINVNVGKALYAVASLFNHSCDPNAFISFKGNPHSCSALLCVRLIRPCMEGEEITISYQNIHVSKNHSTRARIRATRSLYGFNCVCRACANRVDEPVKKDDEQYYFKASDYYQKGKRLIREGKYKHAITVLFQSYECVMRYICPPPRPPQMMLPKTHDALAQAYLLDGDRNKCVEHLKASLALSLELNGDTYPELIREYTKLAFLTQGEDAAQYAGKAKELLELLYCPSPHLDAELAYLDTALRGGAVSEAKERD